MAHTVLVTGASRGLGKAIAIDLAENGFDIVLTCRKNTLDAESVADIIRQKGQKARVLTFDVANRTETADCLLKDIESNGAYYGIVCNAGITRDGAFPALEGDDWDSVLRTNLDGFYNVLHPCIMPMIHLRQGGRIVTLSSVSGLVGNRGQVNYSASKAGLIGATKALAVELGKRNITVNCVAAGIIETDMTTEIDPAVVKDLVPLRRKGTPEEIAGTVSFLFSEKASYITRQVISVNGGMVG